MKFQIGEIAIALSNPPDETHQPRTKGSSYVVLAVCYCQKCGRQAINISGASTTGSPNVRCSDICGHIQPNDGLWWTNSDRFTKPILLTEEIKKAVDNEDYELAQILTKSFNHP